MISERAAAPQRTPTCSITWYEFSEEGWSIKQLHRRIMLSAAYAQAAEESASARDVDPENELLLAHAATTFGVGGHARLDAECGW